MYSVYGTARADLCRAEPTSLATIKIIKNDFATEISHRISENLQKKPVPKITGFSLQTTNYEEIVCLACVGHLLKQGIGS